MNEEREDLNIELSDARIIYNNAHAALADARMELDGARQSLEIIEKRIADHSGSLENKHED